MVKARLDYECYIDIAKTKISLAVSASFVFLVFCFLIMCENSWHSWSNIYLEVDFCFLESCFIHYENCVLGLNTSIFLMC